MRSKFAIAVSVSAMLSMVSLGCSSSECPADGHFLRLQVSAAANSDVTSVTALGVEITFQSEVRYKTFNVGNNLSDGKTELLIELPSKDSGTLKLEPLGMNGDIITTLTSPSAEFSVSSCSTQVLTLQPKSGGQTPKDAGFVQDARTYKGKDARAEIDDTGTTYDAAITDSGLMDSGATEDAGPVDTGAADTGAADTGGIDTGIAIYPDAEPADSGVPSTGNMDGGLSDSGLPPPSNIIVTTRGNGGGTITSVPIGINCPPACDAYFPAGTSVSLTPTPDTGAGFSTWSNACSGHNECEITTSTTPAQIDAEFEADLVAFFAFDGNIQDNSRNGFDLTANRAQFSYNRHGDIEAAVTTSSVSNIGTMPISLNYNDLTVCTWFSRPQRLNSDAERIFSYQDPTTTRTVFGLELINNASDFRGIARAGSNTNPAFQQTQTVIDDVPNQQTNWIHVCLVKRGRNLILFVDGDKERDRAFTLNTPLVTTTSSFRIGNCDITSQYCSTSKHFEGSIDSLKIFGVGLTENEIRSEYSRR